jgi:hypothetical protein
LATVNEQAQNGRQIFFDVGGHDALDRGARLECFDLGVKRRQHDDRLCARFVQRVFQLALGVEGIERRDNRACFPCADLRDDGLRRVGQEQRHAVAFLDAPGHQRRAKSIGQLRQPGIGQALAFENQGRVVRPFARGLADHIQYGLVRIRAQRARQCRIVTLEPRSFVHV